MKTEIENKELRKIIDMSYQSGRDIAIEKAVEWLEKYAENYIWFFEGDCGMNDDFIEDFKKALKEI